jgi:nitroreductase
MFPLENNQQMSTLDQLIYSRRSIRQYKPDRPPDEWIESLIMSAAQAPSPSNRQPVRFVKISSENKKQLIHKALISSKEHLIARQQLLGISKKIKNLIQSYYRFSAFMIDAPWLFAVGTENTNDKSFFDRLVHAGLADQHHHSDAYMDICVGLSVNFFLLKAAELGLGTCILTAPLVFVPDIKKMPEFSHINLKCFITAGFPDESPPSPPKKNFSELYAEI